MANANDIMGYLPVSFKSTEEQNYINFLWESYETGITMINIHLLLLPFTCFT